MWLKYWLFYLLKIPGSPHKAAEVPEWVWEAPEPQRVSPAGALMDSSMGCSDALHQQLVPFIRSCLLY